MNKWGHLLLCSLALLNYAAGERRLYECAHSRAGAERTALKPGGLFVLRGPPPLPSPQLWH